jgi:hypothetical protein
MKTSSNSNDTILDYKLSIYLSNNSTKFQFPWSLNLFQLNSFDFFKMIELFIKTTSLTNQTLVNHPALGINQEFNSLLLNKEMIQYLNSLELQLLESLIWKEDSSIWQNLMTLKIDQNHFKHSNINNSICQQKCPFPFYDDVNILPNQLNTTASGNQFSLGPNSVQLNNPNSSLTHNSSEIILNLTPNPVASSASSYSSPVKHPTITRVVCSSNSNGNPNIGLSSFNDSLSNKRNWNC